MSPAEGEVDNAEAQSPASIITDAENNVGNAQPGESIWISNNLPYITALEDGHSKQAPAGMVALSLAEVSSGLQFE